MTSTDSPNPNPTPDPSSRHAGAATYRAADGTELLVPRLRTRPAAVRRHTVRSTDRLDLLAAAYLGDPHLAWRIADANPTVPPDRLVEPGRTIDIPGRGT